MMEIVYTLLSGKKLDRKSFISYLSGKISKTAKKFGIKDRTNKVYCLDDAVIDVIYGLMENKEARLKKSAFLYCLKKELEIFARLKGIKFDFIEYRGLKLKIREMLDELEKKHLEIKYSIMAAHSQLNR